MIVYVVTWQVGKTPLSKIFSNEEAAQNFVNTLQEYADVLGVTFTHTITEQGVDNA